MDCVPLPFETILRDLTVQLGFPSPLYFWRSCGDHSYAYASVDLKKNAHGELEKGLFVGCDSSRVSVSMADVSRIACLAIMEANQMEVHDVNQSALCRVKKAMEVAKKQIEDATNRCDQALERRDSLNRKFKDLEQEYKKLKAAYKLLVRNYGTSSSGVNCCQGRDATLGN